MFGVNEIFDLCGNLKIKLNVVVEDVLSILFFWFEDNIFEGFGIEIDWVMINDFLNVGDGDLDFVFYLFD